ncbi:MAG: hypothetical protein HYZ54_11370, partial [Ignavibacteriae bacterium]|nr:hypothetical protein [Ignavibacteriota bacterium]
FGMIMPERNYTATDECGYRYGFNGKENTDIANDGDYVDFGARIYDSRLGRWMARDPLQAKYAFIQPYAFCNNNPLIYIDFDGKDWTINTVKDNNGNETVNIKLTAAVLNSSSNSSLDMNKLADAVKNQVVTSYSIKYTKKILVPTTQKSGLDGVPDKTIYTEKEIEVTVKVTVDIRVIKDEKELNKDEHLIQVLDETDSEVKGNYGVAEMGGKELWLNAKHVDNMINGKDNNTIPHELGHTAMLKHPDEQSWLFGAIKGEQYMEYNDQTKNNIMWSNKEGYKLDDKKATEVAPQQIEVMKKEYEKGNLNQ